MQCSRDCPYWHSGANTMQSADIFTNSSFGRKNPERSRYCFPDMQSDCNNYRSYREEVRSLERRSVPFQVPSAVWQHLNYRFMCQSSRNLNFGLERFFPPIYVGSRLRTEIYPSTFPVSCAGNFSQFWRVHEHQNKISHPRSSFKDENFDSRRSKPISCEANLTVYEDQDILKTKCCESLITPDVGSDAKELRKDNILLKSRGCEVRPAATRKSSNHENAWGGPTYTELITEAILSTPEQRMTLSQIYDWITENVEYFKERKNFTSARGWKNAIRHTLSLRKRFMRVARTTGAASWYNSWWMINEQYMRGRQVSKDRRHEGQPSSSSSTISIQPQELQITTK